MAADHAHSNQRDDDNYRKAQSSANTGTEAGNAPSGYVCILREERKCHQDEERQIAHRVERRKRKENKEQNLARLGSPWRKRQHGDGQKQEHCEWVKDRQMKIRRAP